MNKIVHVPAYFVPLYKEKTVKVRTGETTLDARGREKEVVRKEKRQVQTGWSDRVVDSERLANDLAATVERLNQQHYEVVSVTPVLSGMYHSHADWGFVYRAVGYGYGYSFTESLIVVARKV